MHAIHHDPQWVRSLTAINRFATNTLSLRRFCGGGIFSHRKYYFNLH